MAIVAAWRTNFRLAGGLTSGTANFIIDLPADSGGRALRQVSDVYLQALSTHISQLVEIQDHIRAHIQHDWRKLCVELGSYDTRQMGNILMIEALPRKCPLACLVRLAAEMDIHLT